MSVLSLLGAFAPLYALKTPPTSNAVLLSSGATSAATLTTQTSAFTPDISALAQGLVDQGLVPGISVGVVRLNPDGTLNTEYGAWGNRTEDGHPASPEVGLRHPPVAHAVDTSFTDALRDRIDFKGVPLLCPGHSNGRLCQWAQRHRSPTRALGI